MLEKRRYPRVSLYTQPKILTRNEALRFERDIVLSKNVSANGFCFRSQKDFKQGEIIFVYLEENVLDDLKYNKAHIMKSGNYFLARVHWSKPAQQEGDPFFEVGCSFLQRDEGSSLHLFTEFINHYMADELLR